MSAQELLRQARADAELIRGLSDSARETLNNETDWRGYRLSGYENSSDAKASKEQHIFTARR